MKFNILLFCFLFSLNLFSQKELHLSDGKKIVVNKFKERKGDLFYVDSIGKTYKLKSKEVISIKDISLDKENFEYNQLGLTPYVVTKIDSLKQSELYNQTINWIKETYVNPDKVIKATIKNEKVRIEGFKANSFCSSFMGTTVCYGVTYTIAISFKDGRYKFEPIAFVYRIPAGQYTSGGDFSVDFNTGMAYYKNNGRLKKSFATVP